MVGEAAYCGGEEQNKSVVFRDIRRYYCEYCGICRSKKSLIASHVLSHHKEMKIAEEDSEKDLNHKTLGYACEKCGANFKKPAYLRQHMRGHSIERPFSCPMDDCHVSYRRKDHLTRHLLKHQGKLFKCPIGNCEKQFTIQGNMNRHLNEFHDEDSQSSSQPRQKLHICPENGCGKSFKYPSKLKKHENVHVKSDCVETMCLEPGCMKYFTNEQCLRAHVLSCHQYTQCPDCGTKQLKKNLNRHMHTQEDHVLPKKINCSFSGCKHSFSNKSNLNVHVKAVHLEERLFICSIPGCGKKFTFKHVRDKHEKSGIHVYTPGDFLEADARLSSRSRGGRKRKFENMESLYRKRVVPPNQTSALDYPSEYLSWLLGIDGEDIHGI